MNNFKAVKVSIIMIILLVSILTAFMPTSASAQGILQGNIILEYDSGDIPETIRPETGKATIDILVDFFVSGIGSRLLVPFYEERSTVPIEFTLSELPDWVDASISPGVVYQQLSPTSGKYPPRTTYLTISLKPTAPAFQSQNVEVNALSSYTPPVRSSKNKLAFQIKAGYYSNFKYETSTFAEIGAGETIEFPIEITGFANARSKLKFEIVNPPQDWSTSINSEILLGTEALGEEATGTVNFIVQSPLTFGYHNEAEQFNVRVRTYAAGHPEAGWDNTTLLQFTVRARGFSTPGFEVTFSIVALIVAILIYRKKQKNYS